MFFHEKHFFMKKHALLGQVCDRGRHLLLRRRLPGAALGPSKPTKLIFRVEGLGFRGLGFEV